MGDDNRLSIAPNSNSDQAQCSEVIVNLKILKDLYNVQSVRLFGGVYYVKKIILLDFLFRFVVSMRSIIGDLFLKIINDSIHIVIIN